MFDRLKAIEERFDELEQLLASPEVVQDRARYTDLSREHAELRELVELSRQRSSAAVELEEAQALLATPTTTWLPWPARRASAWARW